MWSPSPSSVNNFLELTPPSPTQPTLAKNEGNHSMKMKSTNDKSLPKARLSPSKVTRRQNKPKFKHAPIFRTKKAANFFGVTMKKGKDEAEEATPVEVEREKREARERSASLDISDELPSDVTEKEIEMAKDFAVHAGRKHVKKKDIEAMRTMAAMMGFSTR